MCKGNNDFEADQAAKMILSDVIKLNVSFNEAWDNYSRTWYDGKLSKSYKEETRNLINNIFDNLRL